MEKIVEEMKCCLNLSKTCSALDGNKCTMFDASCVFQIDWLKEVKSYKEQVGNINRINDEKESLTLNMKQAGYSDREIKKELKRLGFLYSGED